MESPKYKIIVNQGIALLQCYMDVSKTTRLAYTLARKYSVEFLLRLWLVRCNIHGNVIEVANVYDARRTSLNKRQCARRPDREYAAASAGRHARYSITNQTSSGSSNRQQDVDDKPVREAVMGEM